MQAPTCQTCGQGTLNKRKKYRMSVPVVLIGYILLIPCVIGMLSGIFGLFATGSAAKETSASIDREVRGKLETAAVPALVVSQVLALKPVDEMQLQTLSTGQRSVVQDAQLSLAAGKIGTGAGAAVAGGLSIVILVMSFVGGLVGWLLIMKKKVLQCTACSATVAAS